MFESDLLGGSVVLHDFESKQIAKRRSEELREEFDRLVLLKWQTVARYGTGDEIEEARRNIDALQTKLRGEQSVRWIGWVYRQRKEGLTSAAPGRGHCRLSALLVIIRDTSCIFVRCTQLLDFTYR